MSQTKFYLTDDVKRLMIELVRGYNRRLQIYLSARENIMLGSPCHYVTYKVKTKRKDGTIAFKECRQYFNNSTIGDPTADKYLRLEALENHIETKRMRAVEEAKLHIGLDLCEEQRQRLTDAIWDSCIQGRNFRLDPALPIGKTNFYERRRKFLSEIAKKTEFL